MAEQVFFTQGNVTITNTRAVFGGQTYALANITSVRSQELQPNAGVGNFFVVVALICAVVGMAGAAMAWLFAIIAGVIAYSCYMQKMYRVVLTTAGAELRAYDDSDLATVQRIVVAINNAIVHRG